MEHVTMPTNGTTGTLSNNFSTYLKCNDVVLFKDLPSFGVGAYISRVTLATTLVVLILPTIFLNLTILVAIIKNRTLWRSSHILVGFLAVTDALVGAISMPLFLSTVLIEIIYQKTSHEMHVYCVLSTVALNAGDLGMGWSFATIALITFERYIAIFAPFWYRKFVRASVMVKATLLTWLIWAVAVALLVVNVPFEHYFGVALLILVFIVYFLAVPASFRIFHLLKKMESGQSAENDGRSPIDRKGSITCAIMLFCLVICYTPLILVSVVIVFKGVWETLLTYLLPWARLILLANSFFNPIIYINRVPLIGRSAKNVFKRFYKRASSRPVEDTAPPSVPAVNIGVSNRAAVMDLDQDSRL